MSKQCKNCLEVYADNSMYCANCGSPLLDTTAVDSALNVGDGNAICGGINVNRSNNITSHDSYYNSTTIHERAKSDSEIKLEAVNQLRGKAEEILTNRGRIDSIAIGQLRPLALQLGLDDATFKTIVKEVRSCRNEGGAGLSAVNARYLQHAQHAVQTNDWDMLLGLKVRLEAMATISPDDDVQYLYHMMLSLLTPLRCIEAYEHQTDENYWRLFWTIVSYVSLERYDEVIPLLASFEPPRFDKPEEDHILLEAYYHIMRADNKRAQDFLDDIIGKPSVQVYPILRAIEASLYDDEPDTLDVRFYFERVLQKTTIEKNLAEEPEFADDEFAQEPILIAEPEPLETMEDGEPNVSPVPDANENEAEELYAEACACSGVERIMLLQKASEAGHADAMYDLSDCYFDGDGVEQDEALASEWLVKSADSGSMRAQTVLANMYFHGISVFEENHALAELYLSRAAERGFTTAQGFMASLYLQKNEYSKALVWANKAAQGADGEAYVVLAHMNLYGLGVTADVDKAFEYFQKAATQNHSYGMFGLGMCYAEGVGCQSNLETAKEWIEKAANQGCEEAQEWLANNTDCEASEMRPNSTPMTAEEEIACARAILDNNDASRAQDCVRIYKKYASADVSSAQTGLGLCYHHGFGVPQNYQQAATWYNKAANQGYALAQLLLGLKYNEGHGCSVNYQVAAKWFRKAANQGSAEAQYRLGLLYISGEGVQVNQQKGTDFIKEAAAQGFVSAIDWLQQQSLNVDFVNNGIAIKNVSVDTDGVKQLFIYCDWCANNMQGEVLGVRAYLHAKSGNAMNTEWHNLNTKFQVKKDVSVFKKTCIIVPLNAFCIDHDEKKKVELTIEFFRKKTNTVILTSRKLTFTVWYHFNFFSKNKFEISSQKRLL